MLDEEDIDDNSAVLFLMLSDCPFPEKTGVPPPVGSPATTAATLSAKVALF